MEPRNEIDKIKTILNQNPNLTHTNLIFKVIENNLESEENINVFLEALKKDIDFK